MSRRMRGITRGRRTRILKIMNELRGNKGINWGHLDESGCGLKSVD